MPGKKRLILHVARGPDAGARVLVEGDAKTVGRSRNASLVLSDPSVSRNHFQIAANTNGAHVVVRSGASPLVFRDQPVEAAELAVGESVIAGSTLLVLAEEEIPAEPPSPGSHGTATIETLVSGVAFDVRGLAAVFALNNALSATEDEEHVLQALSAWASEYAECAAVELVEDDEAAAQDEATSATSNGAVLDSAEGGRASVTVPVPGAYPAHIRFVTTLSSNRISDSLRRLFVVAGAVCGPSLARVRALSLAERERDSMRSLAIGSYRVFSGKSSAAEEVARILPRIAASNVTALLLGETGVGKSFVARLIHESGPRANEPLRIINCAAVPENLVESELFGHERGAFSGAVAAREGVLEAAGRGTVLLDEIGEMPLASQAKLLRVLEERRFERVGSNRTIPLQARVIAATNRDLTEMVTAGTFRQDLYFRLSVVTLRVPALRERANDLLMLAEQILADLAPTSGRRVDGFSRDALDLIQRYPWPGNVRELRNAIEHALVLGEERLIRPGDFPVLVCSVQREPNRDDPAVVRLPAPLHWLEERAIDAALRETGDNRTKAAALLGISRATLHNRLSDRTTRREDA